MTDMTGPGKPVPTVAPATPDDAEYQSWLASQGAQGPGSGQTHDDAEFQAWKARQGTPVAPRSAPISALSTIDNAMTLGLGPKFRAGVQAIEDAVRGRDSFGHSYSSNLAADQAGQAQLAQRHPIAAASLRAVGSAAPLLAGDAAGLIPSAETATGVSGMQRAKAAAQTGGALSAATAIGNTPESGGSGQMVGNALVAGGAGALLGAGAVPAIQVAARAIGDAVASRFGRAASDATTPLDVASRRLLTAMENAGLTPQNAIDRLATIPDSKPVSVMELAGDKSHPLIALGKQVARMPSAGQAQLRATIAERSIPTPNAQRVLGDVADALDVDRVNLGKNTEQLIADRSAAAKPHYDAAFGETSTPVPLAMSAGEELPTLGELLQRPSLKNAVKFHNDLAAEQGESPLVLPDKRKIEDQAATFAEQYPGANVDAFRKAATAQQAVGPDAVPLQTLQRLKFKLDDMLGFAKTNGTLPDGTAATKSKLSAINQTRAQLLAIMKAHSPDYAAGNEAFAGHSALLDASEQGQDFLRAPISDVQTTVPSLTPGERQQYTTAALSGPIRDRLYAGNAIDRTRLFQQPDLVERMQALVPNGDLGPLGRNLDVEHAIAKTNQAIQGGSDTAENLNNDAGAAAAHSAQKAQGFLSGLMMGSPRRALRSLFNNVYTDQIVNRLQGATAETNNALAPKLTAGMQPGAVSRQELMQMLDELATQHDRMQRARQSPPLLGGAAGTTTGQQFGQRNY